jgi:aliphatic nitrilase
MADNPIRVAAVQAIPAYMDLAASVARTVELIAEASRGGAAFVAFSEAWIPGFPFWVFVDSPFPNMPRFKTYIDNSLAIDSPEMATICQAAATHRIFVMLGFSERGGDSLYLAQALIGNDGNLIYSRRKLKPTMAERMVFAEGGGVDLHVAETALGRIGGLCCWEHIGALNKYAMYSQREQMHVAAWPSFALSAAGPYAFGHQVSNSVSRVYAVEGQCFVLAPCSVVSPAMLPAIADREGRSDPFRAGGGFTMIYGPDGRELAAPIPEDQEGIMYAEVDLAHITLAKIAYDPNGHYARPDVTRLWLNRNSAPVVQYFDNLDGGADVSAVTPDGR